MRIPADQLPAVFYIPAGVTLECSKIVSDTEYAGTTLVTYTMEGNAPADEFYEQLDGRLHPKDWILLQYDMMNPQEKCEWTSLGYEEGNVRQKWCWYINASTGEVLSVRALSFDAPPEGQLPFKVSLSLYPKALARKLIVAYTKHHALPAEVADVVQH